MADTWDLNLFLEMWSLILGHKAVTVPEDFHDQCKAINLILRNDITGLISTITNYAIDSAYEAKYTVEVSDNDTLEKVLNKWLNNINYLNRGKIPTGIRELAKEYFKERWQGSSLPLLRIKWKDIKIDGETLSLPAALWFVNGSSIYVEKKDKNNVKLGNYKYYLDSEKKYELPQVGENIIIQKCFARWFDQYPVPYLVKNGVYKNYKAIEILSDKGDEVISKVLPYLLVLKKGTDRLAIEKDIVYDDEDMKNLHSKFKEALKEYKTKKGETPLFASPYDSDLAHLIPDLSKILTEDLFRVAYKNILAGLGFVDVIQGISSTRKESILNPAPFIAEVNAGVEDFKSVLFDLVQMIIEKNQEAHPKFFRESNEIRIVNSLIKINTEAILDQIRSAFIYGAISFKTYQEILGTDQEIEKERREKELNEGLNDLFYPHLIQNNENIPDVRPAPKTTKKEVEKQKEKEKFIAEEEIETALYKTNEDLPPAVRKYPAGAQSAFREAFNKAYPKGYDYAFPVAWFVLKKWLKAHGYKKVNNEWIKKAEE